MRGLMGPKRFGIGTLGLQLRRAMAREYARFRPDVVHVHGLLPAGVLALGSPSPFVVTGHGSEAYALAWRRTGLQELAGEILDAAGRVAAVSDFVAGHLRRLGREDVSVIYNGADERTFAPRDRSESRAKLDFPAARPVIAFTGHIVAEKGVFDLIHAAASLGDLAPVLALAGAGDRTNDARRLAQALNVDVRFFGRLEHERLAVLLGACDVFALPSYAEGLPTAICEAMMAGRAVVATRVGGIPEIVRNDITGSIVEPGDVDALARALRAMLEDGSRRERCAAEAHAFALRRLSWRANAARYEELYEELYGNAIVAESAGIVAGAAAPLVESVPPSATP